MPHGRAILRTRTVEMVPGIGAACAQISNRGGLRVVGVLRPGQDRGSFRLELLVVSSNSARVRPLGMALVMCVLVNSAKGPTFAGGLRATSVSASAWDVTARATHFVPICWMLAERVPAADSALLINTENLLMRWFQGRLDHSRSPSRWLRMTSIVRRGVGNGARRLGDC